MAHHGSTPQSVLNAPSQTVEVISEQHGLNRRERRQGHRLSLPALQQAIAAGRNTPHVKAVTA